MSCGNATRLSQHLIQPIHNLLSFIIAEAPAGTFTVGVLRNRALHIEGSLQPEQESAY